MVKATKTTKSPFSKIFSIEIPELNIEQWWSSFARLVFMGVSWRRIFFLRGGTRFSFSGADWKLRNVFAVYACNFLLYIYAFFLSSCTKIKFCISLYYCAQKRKRKKEKKKTRGKSRSAHVLDSPAGEKRAILCLCHGRFVYVVVGWESYFLTLNPHAVRKSLFWWTGSANQKKGYTLVFFLNRNIIGVIKK